MGVTRSLQAAVMHEGGLQHQQKHHSVQEQKHSTGGSRVIPQHSTNPAQTRLTSEIGRDRVLSGWYDRAIHNTYFLRYIYRSMASVLGNVNMQDRQAPAVAKEGVAVREAWI